MYSLNIDLFKKSSQPFNNINNNNNNNNNKGYCNYEQRDYDKEGFDWNSLYANNNFTS